MTKKSNRYHNRAEGATSNSASAKRDYGIDDDFFESKAPSAPDRSAKRAKFVAKSSSRRSSGSNFNPIYVIVPVVVIVIVGAVLFLQNQSAATASGGAAPAANAVREIAIKHTVADGKISIPVDEVRKNKLVTFDYKNGNKTVPLTAWVTSSGAIKTAVRMCEPCNGTSFRIEGNTLVCNTCGTRWNLDTLAGISGGCQKYPPEAIASTIVGDNVVFDEAPVQSWTPRAF